MARCEPARSPAAQLRWLAALCRESGRYAGDRVGAEAFASLLHLLVFPGFCGWLRPLTRVELREEAIDTIRAFTVLYREYFGPIVGDDLPSGPRHSFEDYSRVHFLCHMLWDMSPLGILEGSLRDAGRGVLADVLKLPWGGCQHGALLGILFYGRFPEFRQLAREFLEREPRPPERLCNMARWAGADDP